MLSRYRWYLVMGLVTLAAAAALFGLGWVGWVSSWLGTSFKAASGGALGWVVSRYVVRLDLSEVDATHRSQAALSQAILIAGFALAVAWGS